MSPEKERHVTYRRDKGTTKGGNNCPVKRQDAHTQPVFVPNKVLIIMFLGEIQHTQLNMLNPVKRYPGTQYQIKLPVVAIQKKRLRVI